MEKDTKFELKKQQTTERSNTKSLHEFQITSHRDLMDYGKYFWFYFMKISEE